MTYLHALTMTYVVELNPQATAGYVLIPIVGWEVQEGRPLPMTLNGRHTLAGGAAVLHSDGLVDSPLFKFPFDTLEGWLGSNPGEPRKNPEAVEAKTKAPQQTGAQKRDSEANGSPYDIEWTTGTFKNNSFWHYDDAEYEFLFQIDGGETLPKATKKCVKIKRDEFMKLKKNIDPMTVEEIMTSEPLDVEEPDDFNGDDDDGMELL